LLTNKKQ